MREAGLPFLRFSNSGGNNLAGTAQLASVPAYAGRFRGIAMANGRVLVVDDQNDVRDLISAFLGAQGYDTVVAACGEEALPLLDDGDLDLIITDYNMPGMNGWALAEKALSDDGDRPVILMSAFAESDTLRQWAFAGIYEFVFKPFDLTALGDTVRRAVCQRRLRVQNQVYRNVLEGLGQNLKLPVSGP